MEKPSISGHHLTAIIKDRKGKILSIAQNSYTKTHPLQAKYANAVKLPKKVFLHAEIHSIVKCADLSKAHSITVIRLNSRGEPLLAKPCPICMSAIRATNIKVINWTK